MPDNGPPYPSIANDPDALHSIGSWAAKERAAAAAATAAKRKRGAQPGNTNNLKHGLYSKALKELEETDVAAMLADGLEHEIGMMRALMARVLLLGAQVNADDTDDPTAKALSLEKTVNLLGSLGVAATRLAALIKTQRLLKPDADQDTARSLGDALTAVMRELQLT